MTHFAVIRAEHLQTSASYTIRMHSTSPIPDREAALVMGNYIVSQGQNPFDFAVLVFNGLDDTRSKALYDSFEGDRITPTDAQKLVTQLNRSGDAQHFVNRMPFDPRAN